VDLLWWSGKHAAHGSDVRGGTASEGWPMWTSGVRPGREHDTTALRAASNKWVIPPWPRRRRASVVLVDSGLWIDNVTTGCRRSS
jgi:hypothetical protein